MNKPICPRCGKSKSAVPDGDRNYYCKACKVSFDPQDDGDYSDRSPSARLEREERRRDRQERRQ